MEWFERVSAWKWFAMAMYIVNARGKAASAVSVAVPDAKEALRKADELTAAGFTTVIILDNRGREVSPTQLSVAGEKP